MEDQELNKQHNQDDVNPGSGLEQLVNQDDSENLPETNGTGSNRPVPTTGTVIIKDEDNDNEEDSSDIPSDPSE